MKNLHKKKIAIFVTIGSLLLLILILWKVYAIFLKYPNTKVSDNSERIDLDIKKGTTFSGIVKLLKNKDIIKKPLYFKLYTFFSKGDVSIQSGHYKLKKNYTPKKILQTLLKGPIIKFFRVTIPEGKNMLDIAKILSKKGVGSYQEILAKMRDTEFLKSISINHKNIEGFLFPETYKFQKDFKIDTILKLMVKQYRKVWAGLKHKNLKQFRKLKGIFHFNSYKILIMASLVEKETGVKRERPLIAGVFLNRLSFPDFKPKYLQTDPTIIYGCTVPLVKSEACLKFRGRIRRIHLKDKENIYNTYQIKGLTPGPICNPGKAALNAVLNPTESKYLYFVAKKPGGEHYFSRTIKEHEKAVRKYILNK